MPEPTPKPAQQVQRVPITRQKLDPLDYFTKTRDRYADKGKKKSNILLLGKHGTGKTYNVALTAPGPVYFHSFDQDGCAGLDKFVASGRVLVDSQFEGDSVVAPFAYRRWETEFNAMNRGGIFEHIGTYVIDSFTMYAASLMAEILKERGRKPPAERADLGKDPDIVPEESDYLVHQKVISYNLARIAALPCHTVIIGHVNVDQDKKITKQIFAAVMMDGKKFAQLMPSLFSEFYFAITKPNPKSPSGRDYFYRTQPLGIYEARSRIAGMADVKPEEPQDLASILRRGGYYADDKPLFTKPTTP